MTEKIVRKAFLMIPLLACGGPAMNSAPAVVSLQAQGASPSSISVAGGTELQFRNSDAIAHRIDSSDCPELSSPELAAGASFTATVGAGPKTCRFDDALQPSAASFQGTVDVQASYGDPYGT